MPVTNKIKTNVPLAPYTTFKIGGPADFFVEIESKDELEEAFGWAKEKNLPFYFLGGGSNILISDKGLRGLTIKLGNKTIDVRGERLYCGAGVSLAQAAQAATGHKFSGLEWAYGIPRATVGGAIRGNAEAFGTNMSDLTETEEVYNAKKKRFELYSKKDCKFEYRGSIFKKNGHLLIWQGTLKLFAADGVDIDKKVEKVLGFRNAKQPKLPSAGCIFKNVSADHLKESNPELYSRADRAISPRGEVSAGWLIDSAGLKGKTIGGAKISLEHANFIINIGKATAEDIITLISYTKQQVRDKFRIQLSEEIGYLAFE